jgi:hypothetical protein
MKRLVTQTTSFLFLFSLLFSLHSSAQNAGAARPSPADSASGKIGSSVINIRYSSPSIKGRTVWGDLVPYGKVWRAGANEATTFETSSDVQVEGKTLPAGKYSLFTIPGEKDWTVIFNKTANQWGAFRYNQEADQLRVTVTPRKSASLNERLAYALTNDGFVLRWENLEVPVAVK